MKNIFFISLIALVVIIISSCCKPGNGGEATIVVFPQHHGKSVISTASYLDTIYVKFDAKDLPSDPTKNYDAMFIGEEGEDHIHCKGLHCGNYYLYAAGFDTTMSSRVTGGLAVKISYSDRKKEVDVDVPIAE